MPILHSVQKDFQISDHLLPYNANHCAAILDNASDSNPQHPTQVNRSNFIEPRPSVDDDSDSRDDVPLSKLKQHKNNKDSRTESDVCSTTLNESYSYFCEILKTPDKVSSPKTTPRAKAINRHRC